MQNKQISLQIRSGSIEEVVSVSQQVPELHEPYPAAEYQKRLRGAPHLILVAIDQEKVVGFKVAYEREGFCYSWMGGVLPEYRRYGLARKLAEQQERWAKEQGYDSITFKTLNRHKAMLCFALQRDFNIFRVDPHPTIGDYRIWLRKML